VIAPVRPRVADRSEAGAATLLAVAMAGVLLMVGAALAVVGAMVVAHRQAQASADLAALAGATAAARGEDPCQAARVVARLNGGTLVACAVDESGVTVQVRVLGPHWLGQESDLEARARAGPDRASTDLAESSWRGLDEE
jgi:secretion/DNA translocation related TadE-like protein